MKKKNEDLEYGINIHLFKNIYIGSDRYEYFIYKLEERKDKNGNMEEWKDRLCHYSKLDSLLNHLTDFYIRNFSKAKNFEELKEDIKYIQNILDKHVSLT